MSFIERLKYVKTKTNKPYGQQASCFRDDSQSKQNRSTHGEAFDHILLIVIKQNR